MRTSSLRAGKQCVYHVLTESVQARLKKITPVAQNQEDEGDAEDSSETVRAALLWLPVRLTCPCAVYPLCGGLTRLARTHASLCMYETYVFLPHIIMSVKIGRVNEHRGVLQP
jgi:hypothetical protein